ncbi:MAG: amidase [Burkholderiaceae bacterium]|nr:amidase [Burkholderiaceae bacterium]
MTQTILDRIDVLQPRLAAYSYIDHQGALARAAAVDALHLAGVDLGPLMGLPIALKDLYSVRGMPTNAGSRVDISDLVPPQGPFVTALQRAGCVVLGKTTTTEFAMGGINLTHRLPWNPCDSDVARMTGGSSHGSAVAMAAGMAAITFGTDTGGSVRWPAALCGVVGYKASNTHWPVEGVFPLSKNMDSLGVFTNSAADAAFVEAAIRGNDGRPAPRVDQLVLGVPMEHYFDHIDRDVRECFDDAVARLRSRGAQLVPIGVSEAHEHDALFARLVPAEWLAFFGRERFIANKNEMDPLVQTRASTGMDVAADEYLRHEKRRVELIALMSERMRGLDAWVAPTVVVVPGPVTDFDTIERAAAWNKLNTQNTRPGNVFAQCGVSLPIQHLRSTLPVGLQLCCAPGEDTHLLEVARAVEDVVGRAPAPDVGLLSGATNLERTVSICGPEVRDTEKESAAKQTGRPPRKA